MNVLGLLLTMMLFVAGWIVVTMSEWEWTFEVLAAKLH